MEGKASRNVELNIDIHLLELLLKGNLKEIDPQKPIEEQTHHLPYDERWEFPANQLKLSRLLIYFK